MDRNFALEKIEKLISAVRGDYSQGEAVGFIDACYLFGLIDFDEMDIFKQRALGLRD